VLDAARRLAELDVGSMPICGEDNRLKGMLTDRDIVVKVLAQGKDPAQIHAGELGEGKPVTIGADDSVDEALRTMIDYRFGVYRLSTDTIWSASSARQTSPRTSTSRRLATWSRQSRPRGNRRRDRSCAGY
jgi:CBS domain